MLIRVIYHVSNEILHVGGRGQHSKISYASKHPTILHAAPSLTRLIIYSEHLRLLHAGPQLLTSMLSYHFQITGHKKAIRSITSGCVTCRKSSMKPKPQFLGQPPMERVTPDFLIGRPLPDLSFTYRQMSLLRHWHLCQRLVRHFWNRWHSEYLTSLRKYTKWKYPSRNVTTGDLVISQENNVLPASWPLGRVIETHTGRDGSLGRR